MRRGASLIKVHFVTARFAAVRVAKPTTRERRTEGRPRE